MNIILIPRVPYVQSLLLVHVLFLFSVSRSCRGRQCPDTVTRVNNSKTVSIRGGVKEIRPGFHCNSAIMGDNSIT